MHHTDKYSQHSSIIWPVWVNGWLFIFKLSSCRFESSCVCLLDYNFFKNYYKTTAVDLTENYALDADPKAIQQINFTGILILPAVQQCFSLLKKQDFLFFTMNCKSILILFFALT